MLLPLACLKRDFLKVLQSLRGYIGTILPKSLGHIARVAYRQACPEAVVHGSIYHVIVRPTNIFNSLIIDCNVLFFKDPFHHLKTSRIFLKPSEEY